MSALGANSRMKAPFLLAALCAGPLGAIAQTTLQIAECDDLPSSITTDTTLQFTAQEVIGSSADHRRAVYVRLQQYAWLLSLSVLN